ncbi:MAG: hypothetical protein U0R80_09010 [Nocardioidaceae bacterium]
MRLTRCLLVLGLAGCALLAGCGSDEASPPSGAEPVVIEVSVENGAVTPNGERVEVSTGQEVEFDITADAPGELHVHSSPEQSIDFDEGETSETITIDTPGTVDVELHEPALIVVQLQVS